MDAESLRQIAESNGWDVHKLATLFEYKWDELGTYEKSVEGIIQKAINDGDDPTWILEIVELPPQ